MIPGGQRQRLRQRFVGPVSAAAGGSYSAEATAYFTAMSVQPSAAQKDAYNAFIEAGKANGWWARFRNLAIPAAHSSQAGLLDMKNPARTFTAVGMAHTAGRGMANNPRANANGITAPEALDAGATASDHAIFAYVTGFAFQSWGGLWVTNPDHYVCIGQPGATQAFRARACDITDLTVHASAAAASYNGLWLVERTGANARRGYKPDGSSVADGAAVSGNITADTVSWGMWDGGSNVDPPAASVTYAAVGCGAALGPTMVAAFRADLIGLLTSLGAN